MENTAEDIKNRINDILESQNTQNTLPEDLGPPKQRTNLDKLFDIDDNLEFKTDSKV